MDTETTHRHTGTMPVTLTPPACSTPESITLLTQGHLLGLSAALDSRGGQAWQDFLRAP